MERVYPVAFLMDEKVVYTIWRDSTFVLVKDETKIERFENLDELKGFCDKKDYILDEEISYIDCNEEKLLDFENFSCKDVLNFWNIVIDISDTLGIVFESDDTDDDNVNSVYRKLFSGCNLSSCIGERKRIYTPFWTAKHKYTIRKIIKEGIDIVNKTIGKI